MGMRDVVGRDVMTMMVVVAKIDPVVDAAAVGSSLTWMPRAPLSPPLVGGRAVTQSRTTATTTGPPPKEAKMLGTGVMNMAAVMMVAGTMRVVAMKVVAVEMAGA